MAPIQALMARRPTLRRHGNVETTPRDHPGISKGWGAVEHDRLTQWRWTNGAAELMLEPRDPALLEFDIDAMPAYRVSAYAAA